MTCLLHFNQFVSEEDMVLAFKVLKSVMVTSVAFWHFWYFFSLWIKSQVPTAWICCPSGSGLLKQFLSYFAWLSSAPHQMRLLSSNPRLPHISNSTLVSYMKWPTPFIPSFWNTGHPVSTSSDASSSRNSSLIACPASSTPPENRECASLCSGRVDTSPPSILPSYHQCAVTYKSWWVRHLITYCCDR